ncbi:hypothetical protein ARAM_006795 [Aspergillus rambellii]|uniref:Eukaryotic translation initiation factor 3 subunit J n=1 Tax=Aspergillus rambellii TaxID=308745 RepID=A0A0F8UV57_9EURO|nr:hypothetical protein ARAM_006795 [Aspergillus rambellii]
MAPSKWDDEEEDSVSPPPVAARRRFDDEEEDDVIDSWDAAEDSEVEREKATKAAAAKAKAEAEAAAKKKSKGQRIVEHQESRRKAAEEAEDDDDDETSDEDEADRRARLRATEKDADLKHAEDLFGDIDLNRNRGKNKAIVINDSADPTQAVDLSAMPLFKPTTKEQFERLTSTLGPLLTLHSKKPQYALWMPEFAKHLAKEMSSADIKKAASALTTLSNEKMREERAADKGSKKTKAAKTKVSLVASRDNRIDSTSYDDDGLDDGDFM